jgi:hypothetical protein
MLKVNQETVNVLILCIVVKKFWSWIYFTTRVKVTLLFGVKLTPYLPELKWLWIWSHSVTVASTLFPELNLLHN